jgi:hypothetical protein
MAVLAAPFNAQVGCRSHLKLLREFEPFSANPSLPPLPQLQRRPQR